MDDEYSQSSILSTSLNIVNKFFDAQRRSANASLYHLTHLIALEPHQHAILGFEQASVGE